MKALRNTATLPAAIPALLYVHLVAFPEQIATTGFAPRLALAIPEHSEETLSAAVCTYRPPGAGTQEKTLFFTRAKPECC